MMALERIDKQVLKSCYGHVYYAKQAVASVSSLFEIDAEWILLAWLYRTCPQDGRVNGWSFFFHGHDCDLTNTAGITVSLGIYSLGRSDSFSQWGLANFIGSSELNPFVSSELRASIMEGCPGSDIMLINEAAISVACGRLLDLGYLERRSGLHSIVDIPKELVSRYPIKEDSYLFSTRRDCLGLTAKGMEWATSEH